MKITMNQSEITAALKQSLTNQGIDTVGKVVTISFTVGRKGSGTSADINIDEAELPDFGAEPPKPSLTVVAAAKTEASNPPIDEPEAKAVSLFS